MPFSTPANNSPGHPHWPDLPFDAWKDTCATLHMWTQIVGKIRLVQTPWLNHSWHVPLYLTARGMTTSPIPCGERSFQIDFDFIDHHLQIRTSDAMDRSMALRPRSVADFFQELFAHLAALGLDIRIHAIPNEVVDAIPFAQDQRHASYDAEYANRFWRALTQADRVFKQFRAGYIGKCSPVHFFWGSFDLAVTRFSGRTAPRHPGGVPNCPDWVVHEAYSHEVSSCGFWPGSEAMPAPMFYAYAYPEPPGYKKDGTGRAGRSDLQHRVRRVHAALRRSTKIGGARCNAARIFAGHLRGGGEPGAMGSRGQRTGHGLNTRRDSGTR